MIKLHRSFWLAPLLLAGCMDSDPTTPALERSVFSILGGLEVGEELTLSGAEADSVLLNGGPSGAEFLYVPFFASEAGQARLQVEVRGTNLQSTTTGGASRSVLAASTPLGALSPQLRIDSWEQHEAFRARTGAELEPLIRGARQRARQAGFSRSLATTSEVPTVGSLIPLSTGVSCRTPSVRQGRVVALSRSAIIVADTANPAGGFTQADYEGFARTFDELISPVLTRNFGDPTDIDQNQRVIVFFTRAVNEMIPPRAPYVIGGFFWAGDLFPKSLCPGSNQAEMFYQLVPDPQGQVNGNRFSANYVRSQALGTIGHEFQHLINAGRRIYVNDAEDWEEVWLDEGLSHIAEELLFYAASGLQPGRNLGLQQVVASQQILSAVNTYQVDNLVRYAIYLESPDEESLLGLDNLETRGAAWAFLRYAADHDAGSDEALFRRLVNSPFSGVENLSRALGTDPIDLMQTWTASVYTDDFVSTRNPLLRQPSWRFRDLIPALYQDERWPLKVHALSPDGELTLRLRGGGAAFVTLKSAVSRQATVATTSGGRVPPDRLRVTVVRTR